MARKQSRVQQPDYVEFGSNRHAEILGLKKADKDDALELGGWTLVDLTAWGPQAMANDMAFLREKLRGKVSTLQSGPPPTPQSEDPFADNYAPPPWPHEEADEDA